MEALGNAFQQSSEEILEDIRNQVAIEADIAGHADDDLKPAAKDADEADKAGDDDDDDKKPPAK